VVHGGAEDVQHRLRPLERVALAPTMMTSVPFSASR
jgi:hypothetical protein